MKYQLNSEGNSPKNNHYLPAIQKTIVTVKSNTVIKRANRSPKAIYKENDSHIEPD